jgi:hypothetical protein
MQLSREATDFGSLVQRAFEAAGGDEIAQASATDPDARADRIEPILNELDAWALRPRSDLDDCEAAAALCRSAGYWAISYPLAERLARPENLDVTGLVLVNEDLPQGAVAGLGRDWAAASLAGNRYRTTVRSAGTGPLESPFIADLELEPVDQNGITDFGAVLTLQCWTLLGMLDRAMELTKDYVPVRQQFGRSLAQFQSVRFQLADAEVERSGLEALCNYALWSMQVNRPDLITHALALRVSALEAADIVLRTTHQLHGAIGFCDESSLSWVSRASAALRHLPFGLSATRDALSERLGVSRIPMFDGASG